VIVGIQPTVAFAMVRLGMGLDKVHTALDLEEGLESLGRLLQQGQQRQSQR
jgi:rsbT antagonist protein RsbS